MNYDATIRWFFSLECARVWFNVDWSEFDFLLLLCRNHVLIYLLEKWMFTWSVRAWKIPRHSMPYGDCFSILYSFRQLIHLFWTTPKHHSTLHSQMSNAKLLRGENTSNEMEYESFFKQGVGCAALPRSSYYFSSVGFNRFICSTLISLSLTFETESVERVCPMLYPLWN